jgi:hypothetical protein
LTKKEGLDKSTPGLMLPTLPTLLIEIVPVPSLMWWCVYKRKNMVGAVGADVIKQGHGTITLVADVGVSVTLVATSEGGGAFVDAQNRKM